MSRVGVRIRRRRTPFSPELGGPEVPGIGFAIGQDRLIDVLPQEFRRRALTPPPVGVVAIGEVPGEEALAVAEELRRAGIAAVCELAPRSVGAALKRMSRLGAASVVLLGKDELAAGEVTVKDLATGEQGRVPRAELPGKIRRT